jgi:hypothetical protein
MSGEPDELIRLPVIRCQHSQANLEAMAPTTMERRPVGDVPPPRVQVTEYQGEWTPCPHGQRDTSSDFPGGVTASVHDGPRGGAMAVSAGAARGALGASL